MTDNEKEIIKEVVNRTIEELKQNGMLIDIDYKNYTEIREKIRRYYEKGRKNRDKDIDEAIKELKNDEYIDILEKHYHDGMTIEKIAEEFDVSTATIKRNKKRLCLEIYKKISKNR
ncbi:MAG: helix-turn-helix domain-containing protein [Lachnospiraceae bacterium]|nr:helix-turn-helix domain-containing protein [Lachnospiraceae bacterium]